MKKVLRIKINNYQEGDIKRLVCLTRCTIVSCIETYEDETIELLIGDVNYDLRELLKYYFAYEKSKG